MNELIEAGNYVVLRLPSELLKLVELQPNTTISVGKYGGFKSNHIIGRPYHLTYEILDVKEDGRSGLRIVSPTELNELALGEISTGEDTTNGTEGVYIEVVGEDGQVVMQTNQHILSDGSSQKLTTAEIEALKKADGSGGKDIIAKLLESHSAIDKKTSFSLAKYTLRKIKKYMKRFTVLPLDLPTLIEWIHDGKDSARIMEIREETLGLVTSWSNAHCGSIQAETLGENCKPQDDNRWLVVDEASGLLVAALAERLGILYPRTAAASTPAHDLEDFLEPETNGTTDQSSAKVDAKQRSQARIEAQEKAMTGTSNTITIVHQNVQPNLSILTYFGYNVANPDTNHPLYTNLKEISFLQLLRPEEDYACMEPPNVSDEKLKEMKSRQKSSYYRKRRRWQRTTAIVDETQAGGFAGLVVASVMTPASVLHRLVPLLRGGAQVVVYSPSLEPLTELMDCYSKARRTAFIATENPEIPSEEFPADPRLLIGMSLHTAKSRPWQVLPGRTHPKMTGRGGAEGYVFVATRVQPVEGKIEARGGWKRRKLEMNESGSSTPQTTEHPVLKLDDHAADGSKSTLTNGRKSVNGKPNIDAESMDPEAGNAPGDKSNVDIDMKDES